ncbi:MAG: hypothetical protein P1V20_17415 [Verrucomicrobiales bacterium]|nr:hypothetical protein [Verrucomicrobiales bacterium]
MSYEEIIRSADLIKEAVTLPKNSFRKENPNHNLWNNHGTWWCHFTIHHRNHSSERVRVSLKTTNLGEARARRDQILRAVA